MVRFIHFEYLRIVERFGKTMMLERFRCLHVVQSEDIIESGTRVCNNNGSTADIYKSYCVYFKIYRTEHEQGKITDEEMVELEKRVTKEFCWSLVVTFRPFPGLGELHRTKGLHLPTIVSDGRCAVGFAIKYIRNSTALTTTIRDELTLVQRMWIFVQLIDSVARLRENCHSHHGDINLNNVLITTGSNPHDLRPTIIDYGEMDACEDNDNKMVKIFVNCLGVSEFYKHDIESTRILFGRFMILDFQSEDSLVTYSSGQEYDYHKERYLALQRAVYVYENSK